MPWTKTVEPADDGTDLERHELHVGHVRVDLFRGKQTDGEYYAYGFVQDYALPNGTEVEATKLAALRKLLASVGESIPILADEIAKLEAERLIALECVGIATDVVAEPAA